MTNSCRDDSSELSGQCVHVDGSQARRSSDVVRRRVGFYEGSAVVSWPFGQMRLAPDGLTVRARGAGFLAVLTFGRSELPSVRTVQQGDLVEVRRTGGVLRWGVLVITRSDRFGLWGPGVWKSMTAVPEVQSVMTIGDRSWSWRWREVAGN